MKTILMGLAFVLAHNSIASAALTTGTYLGIFSGNDDKASVELALGAPVNLIDIALFDKSDENPVLTDITYDDGKLLSGSWDVINNAVKISFVTVKASNEFALYQYDPAVNAGLWTTAGITNNNGKQQNLSHLSFWSQPDTVQTPEPASIGLLGTGLSGIAFLARRRKVNKA